MKIRYYHMRYYFLTLFMIVGLTSFGQRALRYSELNFTIGSMNYNGEITTSTDPSTLIREMRVYAGIDYNYYFTSKFGMGVNVGYGRLTADDLNHNTPERGLSFTSDLVQINGQMIYNFRRFGRQFIGNRSTIYLKGAGGVAWVHTNYPEDIVFPSNVTIYPGTNSSLNLGLGAGVKWRVSRYSTFSVEFMGHFLYSDLMEGFEIKDQGTSADGYGGIRIGYAILLL